MKKFFYSALFAVVAIAANAQAPCTDLFFSEYVEGTQNNKAIEIYNPTANPITLTGYKLQLFTNGSATAANTLSLTGTIAPGGVFVVANAQANTGILNTSDTTSNGVINFNGNDAFALLFDTTLIDVIGEIGDDPGNNVGWPVGTGSTYNHTLVRKPSVHQGSKNWITGATEWNVLAVDSFQLGGHTMTACGDTTVRFASVAATVAESAGTYTINVVISETSPTAKTVDVSLRSGDAADIGNFVTTNVTIPANATTATVVVTITNDTTLESDEQFEFLLTNASGGVSVDADSVFTLTITDDDAVIVPPPHYTIAEVTHIDSTGLPDSTGVTCTLSGTVYGINLRNSGLQFTINDGTGGIGVFSSANDFGYTVNEGDSVTVTGDIGQFLGLTQIVLDTLDEVGSGTLEQPLNTTVLDESTESELVRINDVWLVDPSEWNDSIVNGFAVEITNGTNTYSMRIEEQVDLFSQNPPTVHFDVIGLGGQFDSNPPYTEGYQILPRYSDDLLLHVGIGEKSESNFVIYPNPTQGIFTLKLAEQSSKEVTIRMIDLAGRIVLTEKKTPGQHNISIDASSFARGLYIVEITSGASVQRQKVSVL